MTQDTDGADVSEFNSQTFSGGDEHIQTSKGHFVLVSVFI